MVASSEQHNAPVMVSKPAIVHASKSQPGAPLSRADSADVIKMPEPIIDPITIMVASIGPRARTKPDFCGLSFISRTSARACGRLPSRDAISRRARNRLLRDCRRADKSFLREHRHPRRRPIALCLRVTFEQRAARLHLDHEAKHSVGSAKRASRRSNNFGPRKLRERFVNHSPPPLEQAQYSEAQREAVSGRAWQWLELSRWRAPRGAPPYYKERRVA